MPAKACGPRLFSTSPASTTQQLQCYVENLKTESHRSCPKQSETFKVVHPVDPKPRSTTSPCFEPLLDLQSNVLDSGRDDLGREREALECSGFLLCACQFGLTLLTVWSLWPSACRVLVSVGLLKALTPAVLSGSVLASLSVYPKPKALLEGLRVCSCKRSHGPRGFSLTPSTTTTATSGLLHIAAVACRRLLLG